MSDNNQVIIQMLGNSRLPTQTFVIGADGVWHPAVLGVDRQWHYVGEPTPAPRAIVPAAQAIASTQPTGAGLEWALAIMAVAAISIGFLAQSWKRRTGAAWAIGTFFFMLAAYLFMYFDLSLYGSRGANEFQTDVEWASVGIMAAIFGVVVVAIIVMTLPKKANQ